MGVIVGIIGEVYVLNFWFVVGVGEWIEVRVGVEVIGVILD